MVARPRARHHPAERRGHAVLRLLAAAMELASKVTGTRPMIDRSQLDEFAGKYGYFDSSKAVRELFLFGEAEPAPSPEYVPEKK